MFPDESPEDKTTKSPHKIVITEVKDGAFDLNDIKTLLANKKNALTRLKGDGDFRSPECIKLLKEADIVATNPPFSLFREYIAQLVEYDKKFIIVGNWNAVSYKDIFTLIKANKLWIGHSLSYIAFKVPSYYEEKATRFWIDDTGQKWRSMGNVCWFTNLDHKKRHEEIILYEHYTSEKYPKYDNYAAININKVVEIPCDYDGIMGVPVTYLDKYNPQQFEIIGMSSSAGYDSNIVGMPLLKDGDARPLINGKTTYARIFIRSKK